MEINGGSNTAPTDLQVRALTDKANENLEVKKKSTEKDGWFDPSNQPWYTPKVFLKSNS